MKNILITKGFFSLIAMGMWLSADAYSPIDAPTSNMQAFASTISAANGCDCENPDNNASGSSYYFAETVVIEGDPGDIWTVNMTYSVGLMDAPGTYTSGAVAFTETSSGTYELDFWHLKASGYSIHASNSAGDYLSINGVCFDHCISSCEMSDGLIINDCVSDDAYTFSLNPSGVGFSGTYNLTGDVSASGVTGQYTSPPLFSSNGDVRIVITDANDASCGMSLDIPAPACASLSMNALNNCDCYHEDNFQLGNAYYFAETVLIVGSPGDTWTVDMSFSVGLYDASGSPMSAPLTFTEVATGIYAFDFWYTNLSGYGLHAYDSVGDYGSVNNYCPTACPALCSIDDEGLLIGDCLPGDRFTFSLNPSGAGFSGTYNLSGDVNASGVTGIYTSPPALSTVGNLNVTITDANDLTCSYEALIPPPACATSTCNIDDTGLTVGSCNAADRFIFTLNPSGAGFSGTYHLSGDVNVGNVTGTYTSPPALTNVGDINVTITDAVDPTCELTVYITPPSCDDACVISDDFNLVVNDCSPDGSRFTFSFEPTGTNFSGVYNLSGDINLTGLTGAYTSPPALTNVEFINVTVTDAADPSCSRTLYVAPPACDAVACGIDDNGLVVNGCLPDDRFTFTLDPSGAGFSGTYNLRGDVNLNGLTGTYTSPPALSNVGDLNITIIDAADPTCRVTVYIPPPACNAAEPTIAVENGCDCNSADNYETNGVTYMSEKVGILGAAGDTWTVDFTYSVGLIDASGAPISGTVTFTETSSGLYELPFWHRFGAGYGLHAYNSAGEYLSVNGVCITPCNEPEMRINTHVTELAVSKLYPNPATDLVNIHFDNNATEDVQIIIFDVFGQNRMTLPVQANQGANIENININQLSAGSYFVTVQSGGKRSTPMRFMKAK